MSEWKWFDKRTQAGQPMKEGIHAKLHCMVVMSGYDKRYTSTTVWRPGQRYVGDRHLDEERFTSIPEAMAWIQQQDADHLWEICVPRAPKGGKVAHARGARQMALPETAILPIAETEPAPAIPELDLFDPKQSGPPTYEQGFDSPMGGVTWGSLTGTRIEKYGDALLMPIDGGIRILVRSGDHHYRLGAWFSSPLLAMQALDRQRKSLAQRTRT